ncbi:MAG: lysine--tRNA ligase, partial [Gammaproteobacteria bacterium]|nr:lysine--tRNA ligase [Gammaproteobacteria bacterium]
MNDTTRDDGQQSTEAQILEQRRTKLAALRAQGNAYPNDFRRDTLAADVLSTYAEATNDMLDAKPVRVAVAGRMMTRRIMGKAAFAHLKDMSGSLQVYVKRDDLGAEAFEAFKSFDLGDILGVQGRVFRTRTGELSLHVETMRLLTKSLRPLPEKWHGLTDLEARYRQRHVDLIVNDEARQVFRVRSRVIDCIRQFLQARGFQEVETPM